MSTIVVNATAIRSSGALTVFNQFIDSLSVNSNHDVYYIFIHAKLTFKIVKNTHYVPINTTSWLKRIYWDEIGLRKWLKVHNLIPDLFISFQNTGANIDARIPQLIYYHQSLPFNKHRWNILKKEQFILFLYQKVYAFFVARYLKHNTSIVVQIPSTKEAFIKKFGFPDENIYVIRPNINVVDYSKISAYPLNSEFTHLIYPATPYVYKNHIDIIKSMHLLKIRGKSMGIRIHFTFKPKEAKDLYKIICKLGVEDNIIFDGSLSYNKLLSLYKSANALLFSSYIETFGLPLIEGANAGLPIIAVDLPYTRDVIGKYDGVTFVPLHDIEALANGILSICERYKRFLPLVPKNESNWTCFFQIVNNSKINNSVTIQK